MSVKPEGLLADIKTLMFCIIQCKLKIWILILIFTFHIINQTYLIIFHPNSLVILEKWNILIVTEVLEQPANESPVHNVVAIREWRHANVDKQRKLLVDVDVTPEARPRPRDCSMFCIEKCKQLGIMVSSKVATLRM